MKLIKIILNHEQYSKSDFNKYTFFLSKKLTELQQY